MDNDCMSPLEQLLAAAHLEPSACSCKVCRRKCAGMMCIGTPDDIVRLINAGYGVLLRPVAVTVVMMPARRAMKIRMVQLMSDGDGCALYKDGRCLVHDLGLKPTEGRYFIHPESETEESLMNALTLAVAMEWADDDNRRKVEYCFSKVSVDP